MKIQLLHQNAQLPTRGTVEAAGFDIYMPEAGEIPDGMSVKVSLGFATAIPEGYVAILNPRSGVGFKTGLELLNTNGWIDSDYRGEWFAKLRMKDGKHFSWKKGERLLQFIVVPYYAGILEVVESLPESGRSTGGLGSTGQ